MKTFLIVVASIAATFAAGKFVRFETGVDATKPVPGTITVSADLATGQHITLTGKGSNSSLVRIARLAESALGDKPEPEPKPPLPPDPLPTPLPTPIVPIPHPAPLPNPQPSVPPAPPSPAPSGLAVDVAAWARAVGRKDDAAKLAAAVQAVAAQVAAGVLSGEAAILKAASIAIKSSVGALSLIHWKGFSDQFTARIGELLKAGTIKTDADWSIVLQQTAAGLAEAAK